MPRFDAAGGGDPVVPDEDPDTASFTFAVRDDARAASEGHRGTEPDAAGSTGHSGPAGSTGPAEPTRTPDRAGTALETSATTGALGRPAVTAQRTSAVNDAADAWRAEIQGLGSASTLADMGLLGDAVLTLSHAHPSGLASLYAGRRTQLRNIVRDPEELRVARRSARVVGAAATELTHRFGLAPTFLAVGVATWALPPGQVLPGLASGDHAEAPLAGQLTFADLDAQVAPAAQEPGTGRVADVRGLGTLQPSASHPVLRVPVLLRPVRLTWNDGPEQDVALQLDPSLEVNPVLVAALREHGIDIDVTAIAEACFGGAGFSPRIGLGALRDAGEGVLPGFELAEEIVVGTFLDPGQVLVDDLAAVRYRMPDSDVLAAVAGDEEAREFLAAQPIPEFVDGDRAPEAERGVGDLGPREQHALDVVAAGTSLLLDAPVGSHPDRLAAAILADAAASGTRTLYVPATKRVGRAVLDRLTAAGLEDLVLSIEADPGWQSGAADQLRRSVAAREVDVDHATLALRREELGEVHTRLARFLGHLHVTREPWGASVAEVMQQLARLANVTPPPLTSVRLDASTLEALQGDSGAQLRRTVHRAAQLGAFTVGPEDTPWYGANLQTDADAAAARERAERLARTTLPRLQAQVVDAAGQTGLTPAPTLAAWAEQLHVLDDVSASLDVFLPQVFERPVDQLVIATAPRAWRREYDEAMGAAERKELRRTAQELVRPGRAVGDLHGELRRVQQQNLAWQALSAEGGWPRVPDDLPALRATEREVRADVDALVGVLAPQPTNLHEMPLEQLTEVMAALAEDSQALRDLPSRSAVGRELRDAGLGELADDLAGRRVPAAQVGAEIDQAWWSGVFHEILAAEPALAGYDGPALTGLATRLRELDLGQVASLAGPVREAVVSRLREAVYADTDDAAALFHSLGSDGGGHLRSTFTRWHDLAWQLRPVRAVAPMLVPQVMTAGADVDLVVLDHPGHLGMPQIAGAIARANRVVVLADVRAGLTGAARELGDVLPHLTLPTARTDVATEVMGLLAAHGYADVTTVVPSPAGRRMVRLDLLTGEGTTGTPSPGGDAIESPPAEVAHVVELVARHAARRPQASLGVVALSERHAAAIRAELRERARTDDALHRFLTARRQENAVAIGVHDVAGLRRDVVVLSVGFGKTVHGRVLHQFGPVSQDGGRALLLEALGAVRHELVVVSCLGPDEIRADRVHAPGSQLLAALLAGAGAGTLLPSGDPMETATLPLVGAERPDQLLDDLAERLWAEGLHVVRDVEVPGLAEGVRCVRIPLAVGASDAPGAVRWAILTDDEHYIAEPSLRVRDRHWRETLEARGWGTIRVFSAAMFLDLAQQARDIAEIVRAGRGESSLAVLDEVATLPGRAEASGPGEDAGPWPALREQPESGKPEGERVTDGDRATETRDEAAEPESETSGGPGLPAQSGDPEEPGQPEEPGEPADPPSGGGAKARGSARPRTEPRRQRPMPRGPRPDVARGLGLATYTDAQLDAMVGWIMSDALPRTDGQLISELRAHLAITEAGTAARAVLAGVVRRYRG